MATKSDSASLDELQQRELLAKLLREKVEREKCFPMSAGQQGLWHAFRRDPASTSFNVFLPTRIRSSLNLDALRASVHWIGSRHPSLRTLFSDRDGVLMQEVHAGVLPDFEVLSVGNATDDELQQIVLAAMQQPFDLTRGPLLRLHVYRVADDDWIVLAVTHHIVVDFWSLVLILGELRVAYPAFATTNKQPEMERPQTNYSRFVADQERLLASDQGKQLQSFWQETISKAAPVLDFPTDKTRPTSFTGQAAVVPLQFDASQVAAINDLAKRSMSTAFAVIHAALQVLLSRYANQDSFFIGSPFSGRTQQNYENTVGFFVNMLPLPCDLQGGPPFIAVVKQTSRMLMQALEHEAYPISHIVRDAHVVRDPGRSPLFQVSCTFERSHVASEVGRAAFLFPSQQQIWQFSGLRQESFYVPHPTCHYDLEFVFEQTSSDLRGMICYCRDLFDSQTMQHVADNFASLLHELLANPDQAITDIEWGQHFSKAPAKSNQTASIVKQKIANESDVENSHFKDSGSPCSVHGLIAASVNKAPDAVAFQFEQNCVTYQQLFQHAKSLAGSLRRRLPEVAPETHGLVPVCSASGPSAFVALLATQLAGLVPIPVDTNIPPMDLNRLLADTTAHAVLCDPDDDYCQSHGAEQIFQIRLPNLLSGTAGDLALDDSDFGEQIIASKLAYAVYTSGSTGQPKCVLVEHAAVCNTLRWRMQNVVLDRSDRVLMLLSHQFDAGLGIAWTTLTQGATLVWADAAARADPALLIEQIVRDRITVLPAVPSLLRMLVTHRDFPGCSSIRLIFTGGEAMPADLPSLIRCVSAARFWNFYGPTEAAVEATACEVTEHPADRAVPIGRPIANTQILVVDENLRSVPVTVPGQLAILGSGLARGYLNDSRLTNEKFVNLPNVLSDRDGPRPRAYLTGDRGRQLASGDFEFLGRLDQQVKLSGYRIELGEIEKVLEGHTSVRRAAVRVDDLGSGNSNLVAFVSLNSPLSSHELRRFAACTLPAYKIPTAMMILPEMPLTASGKVDRKSLPKVFVGNAQDEQCVAPEGLLEELLHAEWCEILQVQQVSVEQNFFDAGGSSLLAAALTSRLSRRLEVRVPTSLLFDLASIRQMATRLSQLYPQTLVRQEFGDGCLLAHSGEANFSTREMRAAVPVAGSSLSRSSHASDLLEALKPGGARPPIFMVHPPGGIVVCYRELARRLPSEQPLFAIRSRGLRADEIMPNSIEEMAAEYLAAVASVSDRSPIVLGGWSLGGLVAYEMAQQLARAGQAVPRLLLLDSTIPEGATSIVPVAEKVNVGLEYGIDMTLDELGALTPEAQLPILWQHVEKMGLIDDGASPEIVAEALSDLQELFHHHIDLALKYRMQPLQAHLDLIRPKEVPFELQVSADRGWRYLVNSVETHFVAGHHHSMVQPPHVDELATCVAKCLQD